MTDRGGKIYCQLLEAQRISGSNRQQRMSKSNAHRQYIYKWLKNNYFLDSQCAMWIQCSCVQSTNNMRYCRIKREQQCKELKEKLTELG